MNFNTADLTNAQAVQDVAQWLADIADDIVSGDVYDAAMAPSPADKMSMKGDVVTFTTMSGYVAVQNRPRDCRVAGYRADGEWTFGCKRTDGHNCNGVTTSHVGVVESITAWMDNSTDLHVRTADGTLHTVQVEAPHGDACF